jgi:DNA-binding NarL/FixJ family response regulator
LHFADASDRVPAGETDFPRLLILGSDAATATMAAARRAPATVQLSRREREILAVVARGMTNAEIAASLELSEHTVKRHVANILTKLDLANRSAAAAFAVQHGLV